MPHCCGKAWALTPRFHPYPGPRPRSGQTAVCFLLHYSVPLPKKKPRPLAGVVPCVARTFLLPIPIATGGDKRWSGRPATKVNPFPPPGFPPHENRRHWSRHRGAGRRRSVGRRRAPGGCLRSQRGPRRQALSVYPPRRLPLRFRALALYDAALRRRTLYPGRRKPPRPLQLRSATGSLPLLVARRHALHRTRVYRRTSLLRRQNL